MRAPSVESPRPTVKILMPFSAACLAASLGERVLILAVGYKHDNLVVVGPGRHGFHGLANGVADKRAAARSAARVDLVEHSAEETVVGRQRDFDYRLAGKDNQPDVIAG